MPQEETEPNKDITGAMKEQESSREIARFQQEACAKGKEHLSINGFATGLRIKPLSFFKHQSF
jgi:hypothetical protein